MIEFQSTFMTTKGQPIQYNGNTLIMMDKIVVPENFLMKIKIISIHSKWKQGIKIKIDKGKGYFISQASNQKSHCFEIWDEIVASGAPSLDKCEGLAYSGTAKNNEVKIWNIWDNGNSVTQAWVMGEQ